MEELAIKLQKLVVQRMPFGKYQNRWLIDLPVAYLAWFADKGFPKGELGEQLQLLYQLKMDGNGDVLRQLHHRYQRT
ncbi:hypothetical protein GCM10011369_30050 [Neiella marina]|uniref:DUF3820 family protein n=1 Tax=Neiella marina TaxID=508461 RepID=A0A8J2U8C9_9GAMM|nr:DUF3820 family protein [Neiella marina]GGA85995.1 hypothetical protein GCM10011369_30050 [Neiella marina]